MRRDNSLHWHKSTDGGGDLPNKRSPGPVEHPQQGQEPLKQVSERITIQTGFTSRGEDGSYTNLAELTVRAGDSSCLISTSAGTVEMVVATTLLN